MNQLLAVAATVEVQRVEGVKGALSAAALRRHTVERTGLDIPEKYLMPDHLAPTATYYFAKLANGTVAATARVVNDKPLDNMALTTIDPAYEQQIDQLLALDRLASVGRLMATSRGTAGHCGVLALYRAILLDSLGNKTHYIFEARKNLRRRLAALGFDSEVIGLSRPFPTYEVEPALLDIRQCVANLASTFENLHTFAFQDAVIDLRGDLASVSTDSAPVAPSTPAVA